MKRVAMGSLLVLAASAVMSSAVAAEEPGPWQLRVGVHNVRPKSDNGTVGGAKATITSSTRPTFNVDYYFASNWAVDLLAAAPFSHDIKLNGGKAGSTKQLPPTLSVQYHFAPTGPVDVYAGAGVTYTRFFNEHSSLGNLKLDSSWGPALQLGADYHLGSGWGVGADVRWMRIRSDAHLNGAAIGTAAIDPIAFGATVSKRF